MATPFLSPNAFKRPALILLCGAIVTVASGCKQDLVHQRPMAELNMKAQQMMQAGDYNGAIARLESALDLDPDEVNTMHNLAVAYQLSGNYDKAIAMFEKLLDKPGIDQAGMLKSLGITYEAKADQINAQAGEIEDKALDGQALGPDDKATAQAKTDEAKGYYQMALDFYQRALPDLKEKADVAAQIQALEDKLSKMSKPAT